MASIRSIRAGLSKSYHNLNTMTEPEEEEEEEFSPRGGREGGGGGIGGGGGGYEYTDLNSQPQPQLQNNTRRGQSTTTTSTTTTHNPFTTPTSPLPPNPNPFSSSPPSSPFSSPPPSDWLDVDNFRVRTKNNNKSSPLSAIKEAFSRVSKGRNYSNSAARISGIIRDLDNEWRVSEDSRDGDVFLGKLRSSSSSSFSKMPSSVAVPPEQASLLGTMPGEVLEDSDLRHVQLSVATSRTLSEDGSAGTKVTVDTPHGPITAAVSGDPSRPVILTYHDLGLNHVTNFQAFFLYPEMRNVVNNFCIVHVNAPGQEEGAPTLPEGYVYPTLEELADTITCVKNHLHLRSFIGFGVGLGANVLARYATKYPNYVDALVLVNCSSTQAGWIEWGYQKLNIRHLRSGTMTTGTVDYLMWHHFGKQEECNQDLVTVYRQHFERAVNPTNLGLLVDSYIRRSDLAIVRELDPNKKKDVRMIRCQVLNITANLSPHIEDTVTFNGRLDPTLATWMKIQDCGLVIDEAPGKVVEAFRLFLQGQGYAVHSRGSRQGSTTSATSSTASLKDAKDIHITENPLLNPTA